MFSTRAFDVRLEHARVAELDWIWPSQHLTVAFAGTFRLYGVRCARSATRRPHSIGARDAVAKGRQPPGPAGRTRRATARTRRATACEAIARAVSLCTPAMAATMMPRPRAALLVSLAAALIVACAVPAPTLAARALLAEDSNGDSNGDHSITAPTESGCMPLNGKCTTSADCCMLKDCVMNLNPNATDSAFCGDTECIDGECAMVHHSVVASDTCLWPGTICNHFSNCCGCA